MILIICAKYKKNPPRTVDATERTRFSKSMPNDLQDIGQGQGLSHATHPLMLLIICTIYGNNPPWNVDATGRTRKGNGQTDGETDRQGESRLNLLRGYKKRELSRSVSHLSSFDNQVGIRALFYRLLLILCHSVCLCYSLKRRSTAIWNNNAFWKCFTITLSRWHMCIVCAICFTTTIFACLLN